MAKPDKILLAYGNELGVHLSDRTLDASSGGYADALKFANCEYANVTRVTVRGGYEDALDINRGGGHLFTECRFESGGSYAATIKGGADNITFVSCTFGVGSETDVDLGNWSDQAPPPARTRGIKFVNCRRTDGRPLRIRRLWADRPILEGTPAKVSRVHPVLLWFFWLGKKLRLC